MSSGDVLLVPNTSSISANNVKWCLEAWPYGFGSEMRSQNHLEMAKSSECSAVNAMVILVTPTNLCSFRNIC